jgi:bacterioferritin (cytochrome b1)
MPPTVGKSLFFSFKDDYNLKTLHGGPALKKPEQTIATNKSMIELLNTALKHEWAVSFEYVIHAYSMPKGKFLYDDPIMKQKTDVRAQTIQIGIDEMYHALQLGIIITQMGGIPSFQTDEVIRFPRIIDNLKRDKMTEDMVTDLYQSAKIKERTFPRIQNMILNISYDEVRHSRQFQAMIQAMEQGGRRDALCFQADLKAEAREEVRLLHDIMRIENRLMHHYLKAVILFSDHQDLSQRLFKNSIDHMRHWDKNSGLLIRMGSVIRIEQAEKSTEGTEKSLRPMPASYEGRDRLSLLEAFLPEERELVTKYEDLLSRIREETVKEELQLHLGLKREHLFTLEWLIKNARAIAGLE